MYLFFDTETTGVPFDYKAPASDVGNWPRLVQLAWVLTDEDGAELDSACDIIKPEGFFIPEDSSDIHGISHRKAIVSGIGLRAAIDRFASQFSKASTLVAHNVMFDVKVIGAEQIRLGLENTVEKTRRQCTMQLSANWCGIRGPYGNKWPTLIELHRKLFNEGIDGSHDAQVDVRACARCYFRLQEIGIIP